MRTLRAAIAVLVVLGAAPVASAAEPHEIACRTGTATPTAAGRPTERVSWVASLDRPTPFHRRLPRADPGLRRSSASGRVGPRDALRLRILAARRDEAGRCWLRVRLPSRPNAAAGWIRARRVVARPTGWRIVINRERRRITLYLRGRPVRRAPVVVGAPGTPTPAGDFSIVGVWRWRPADFLGSYILPLTAHSHVLQEFGGGDGRIGIHGRGGASLLDPLGSAASHGCIRLSNGTIDAIVRAVGPRYLPGIPVRVR